MKQNGHYVYQSEAAMWADVFGTAAKWLFGFPLALLLFLGAVAWALAYPVGAFILIVLGSL